MYHYIRVNPDPRDRVGFALSVTPAAFHAQMAYLARNHFHVIPLSAAVADVEAVVASMSGYALASLEQPAEVYKAGLNSTRLLMALGDLLIGWLLARQAEVALRALDEGPGRDEAFYQGKVVTARFFAETVLPRLAVERQIAERTTLDLMELPEEAF